MISFLRQCLSLRQSSSSLPPQAHMLGVAGLCVVLRLSSDVNKVPNEKEKYSDMRLKLVRVGKSSVGNLPYFYKCKDWVIDICLMIWLGSIFLGEYMGWEKAPWYMYILDFVLLEIAVVRCKSKLPRRCWRTATYYLVYCVAAFAIAYVIIYFSRPGYFTTSCIWLKYPGREK